MPPISELFPALPCSAEFVRAERSQWPEQCSARRVGFSPVGANPRAELCDLGIPGDNDQGFEMSGRTAEQQNERSARPVLPKIGKNTRGDYVNEELLQRIVDQLDNAVASIDEQRVVSHRIVQVMGGLFALGLIHLIWSVIR